MSDETNQDGPKDSKKKEEEKSVLQLSDLEFESSDQELNDFLESLRSLSVINPRYRIAEDREHINIEEEAGPTDTRGVRLTPTDIDADEGPLFEIE